MNGAGKDGTLGMPVTLTVLMLYCRTVSAASSGLHSSSSSQFGVGCGDIRCPADVGVAPAPQGLDVDQRPFLIS